ncbi:MAG TPA: Rieske (2Fe-2S) protein [Nonomuraea sp.]|nr:Rieske (2Fe-2S) protein [Nonomuraea sp.]
MAAADTPTPPDETEGAGLDRRGAIRGFSAMGLAALAVPLAARPGADDPITSLIKSLTGGGSEPEPAPAPAPEPKPETKVTSVQPKGKFAKAGNTPMGSVDEIPVNSGMLFEADQYIVTQPKAGEFVGFDSLCTHEGCPVDVFDRPGIMACSCHSTDFKITNGAVIKGPAKKPMPQKPIVIENGKIYKAKKAK